MSDIMGPETLTASTPPEFTVGQVVLTPSGHGIVTTAELVAGADGSAAWAYRVASLGQSNDSPLTSEVLGLKAL